MDKIKVGLILKNAREYLDLSIKQVANILAVSAEEITNIESGNFEENSYLIPLLEKIYGIDIKEELAEQEVAINTMELDQLSDNDRKEVVDLVRFIKMTKEQWEERNESK